MKRLLLLAALSLMAMLIFVSVAIGAQKQATNEVQAQKHAKKTVLIKDFRFAPAKGGQITVRKGTRVTWINKDRAPHTVTANNGEFSSRILEKGETYSKTFRHRGVFRYHCELHPDMRGSVVVKRRR